MSTNPFRYFKASPEIIRLAVMLYVRFPLSLRSVEDVLHERGIDVSHETVRYWWNRFGPTFAAEIGTNWAIIASLVETCKLNEINPHAWLADTLTKLVNRWPASRIDELMPWNDTMIGAQPVNV